MDAEEIEGPCMVHLLMFNVMSKWWKQMRDLLSLWKFGEQNDKSHVKGFLHFLISYAWSVGS